MAFESITWEHQIFFFISLKQTNKKSYAEEPHDSGGHRLELENRKPGPAPLSLLDVLSLHHDFSAPV